MIPADGEFCPESVFHNPRPQNSLTKTELVPDIVHMDVTARQETLASVADHSVFLQIPLVPCYALTIHKTQALSIRHIVRGCLEGVFASANG